MIENQKSIQKTIRIPKSLVDRIEALPPREGHDFATKAKRLLEIGLERLNAERKIVDDLEYRQNLEAADRAPDYGKPNGTNG